MPAISFFDILGIDRSLAPADQLLAAADVWPSDRVHFLLGEHDDSDSPRPLLEYLQTALTFRAVRPGGSATGIGFYAEVEISNPVLQQPLVLRSMPDVAFRLQDTAAGKPARCYATKSEDGYELLLEALPMEIQLPAQLITPRKDPAPAPAPPPAPLVDPFVAGIYDSYRVVLSESGPSSLFVHLRVRITREWDVILEPAVVLSVGPCLFTGLPCYGLHDISLIPSPTLRGAHEEYEQALEWTRHTIEPSDFGGGSKFRGCIAVRTVDLDSSQTPLKELHEWLNTGEADAESIQFVLEDVVFPFFGLLPFPLPLHATFGIRRNIAFGNSLAEAYSFAGSPVQIKVGPLLILVEELLLESSAPDTLTEGPVARVRIIITLGDPPKSTTLASAITASDTTLTVADTTVFGPLPFSVVVGPADPNSQEIIAVENISGNDLLILERGAGSTTARVHPAGVTVRQDLTPVGGVTVGFTEEGVVQLGWQLGSGYDLFTIGDVTVSFWAAKLGFSFGRLGEDEGYGFADYFQLLLDLGLDIPPAGGGGVFRIESLSNRHVQTVWRDLGWSLGSLSLGSSEAGLPEGVQVVVVNVFKLIFEEIALVTDPNGGTYFSVSGGLSLAPEKFSATILLHRLKYRIAGSPQAPAWTLDGISFALTIGSFEMTGTGMVREFLLDGHSYNELQFGLSLKFTALGTKFDLSVFLFKGKVSGPTDNFRYQLMGLRLGFLPVGSIDLYNIRLLIASNLAPQLPPPGGSDQNLRIFQWYRTATTPLGLPDNKKLNAWVPQDDSSAFGVGAGGGIGGSKALVLDLFAFGHSGAGENGFMIALEIFLLKSSEAVGIGVLEVDLARGKWGLFVAVSLSFSNILPEGVDVPGLENVAALSGSLYLGNQPGTFALGQLSDQDTWLGFRMKEERFFKLDVVLAICMQFVDRPEGPAGFGFLFSAKGSASFGIGRAECYLTFLFIAGIWKNESSSSGLIILFEAGFRIKVFRVFSFGASVRVQLDFLGPNPEYKRIGFEIRIDTPWYLPDVNFRFEKIYNEPAPELQNLVSTPVVSAEALAASAELPLRLPLTPVRGAEIDEGALFDLQTVRGLSPGSFEPDTLPELATVGVDSEIVLNFKPPVDDRLTVGENTPAGAGTQAAKAPAESELAVTYELVSLSVRRRPRYGSGPREWTPLLAPGDTELVPLEDWPSGTEVEALFSSHLNVRWDRDVLAEGRLDPRRLIINSETPFTLISGNAVADESLLLYQPGWPCCNVLTTSVGGVRHVIDYTPYPPGSRAPGLQYFTNGNSTLRWLTQPLPLVANSVLAPNNPRGIRPRLLSRPSTTLATVNFDEPAFRLRIAAYWRPQHRKARLVLDGYHGLTLLERKELDLASAQQGFIQLQHPRGFTGVFLGYREDPSELITTAASTTPKTDWIEIISLDYRTVREELDGRSGGAKCEAGEDRLNRQGQLAWLPNHDYEIAATTRVILNHQQSGIQEGELTQKAYFRTKGMLGLNATEYVGREIEPYVAGRYPHADSHYLYREEPVCLAFTEQFNLLLPVDRAPSPDHPAELNQILEWDLTVDKQGDADNNLRVSVSTPDWIVDHHGAGTPHLPIYYTELSSHIYSSVERLAPSLHPLNLRLADILAAPASCNGGQASEARRSLVLCHRAVNPASPTDPEHWQSDTSYRASLKPKGGPFVNRSPFLAADVTAFATYTAEAVAPASWAFTDGSIGPLDGTASDARRYAVFGEDDWTHLTVRTLVDPGNGAAGLGVGMDVSPSGIQRGLIVLIDAGSRELRVFHLGTGSNFQLAASLELTEDLSPPYQLEITAYDDQLDVRLGELQLLHPRGNVRAGRLALVASGGGSFAALDVEALDAYRFYFRSSRFRDFAEHIASAQNGSSTIPALPAAATLISQLYQTTADEIGTVMSANGDPATRLRLFRRWTEALALPLYRDTDRLTISRLENEQGTLLFLLESPEPLRFSHELGLVLEGETTLPPGCLNMLLPTLGVLGNSIPPEIKTFERQIPKLFPAIRQVTISRKSLVATVATRTLRGLGSPPRYAVTRVRQGRRGQFRDLTFALSYAALPGGMTRVTARLMVPRTNPFGTIFGRRTFRRGTGRLRENELVLLDHRGGTIRRLLLPPITETTATEQAFVALANGRETAVLLVPLTGANGAPVALPGGKYRFRFTLDRERYPQELNDPQARYRRQATVDLTW